MQLRSAVNLILAAAAILGGTFWLRGQDPSPSAAPPVRAVGIPPRPTPADYQFHVQSGPVALAAEFLGHDVPTDEGGPYATEAYVVVSAALYSSPNAKVALSPGDFSLRVNGKKPPVPSQPYVRVFPTLKDPEWEPTTAQKDQALTAAAGGKNQPTFRPAPPQMPVPLRHAMEQRVLKVSLPEGERTLPQAGLLYFEWRGELKGIRTMELIYDGPAGKATLPLGKP